MHPHVESQGVGVEDVGVTEVFVDLDIEHTEPLRYERVGKGQSNLTFAVTDGDGRQWILRRPPLGALLHSAHDVGREARILNALGPTAVPSPHVLGLRTSLEPPVLVMGHVDGLVIDDMEAAAATSASVRRRVGGDMARTLAAIHAVDLEQAGLASLASHGSYAQRQLRRWSAQWEQSRIGELREVDMLTARLRAAAPAREELTLVHGDFHIRNVILSPEDGAVRAVLDWELSTLGDPIADLGTLLAYWPQPGDRDTPIFQAPALPGFVSRRDMVDRYVAESGRDTSALGFWHSLGLWKLAIITQGVLRRTVDEPRNRARGAPQLEGSVKSIIQRAHDVADEVGI
ncbi:phosphotransferase family protein [Aeromicrobium chenweiae]|uniref:Phosphotransferase family protein n=1 Tax=Aeromicrobium chenweiae TaxID=2079793 RepID=A0A2S0WHY9_9ACTN|nr:phosphotransferase family protein [Aeromicrobium chenweiae]AWB90951.1 phosphotransferase family protein [Aeromicrobium chenweiae]TGN32171.1 phosphotransferase family protein [Aeromicrobium chenweiae]